MKKVFLILAIALLSCSWNAQTVRRVAAVSGTNLRVVDGDGLQVQTLELNSKLLKRKVFFTVILPAEYLSPSASGRVFPVIYLLHGLSGHFDNWTGKTSLVKYFAGMNAIAVIPEGADGWYTDSATKADDKFESYIVEEVVPEVDHRYRTIREGRGRSIAGLSMGGYGAIKFGLKYPDMFSIVGSFSGAFDAPLKTEKSDFLRPSIASVFGADTSKTRAENDIFSLIRNASQERIKSFPFIYLDCGTDDLFFTINREFDALLVEKKVPHEFRELPGKHDWEYWDRQIQEFLRVAAKNGFGTSDK